MNTDFTIRLNTTNDIDLQLLTDADGDGIAESGINLSGVHHIELVLINSNTGGTTTYSNLDSVPKATILSGTAGSIRFFPGSSDFSLTSEGRANIYNGYVWVFPTATKKYSVPENFEFTVRVRP